MVTRVSLVSEILERVLRKWRICLLFQLHELFRVEHRHTRGQEGFVGAAGVFLLEQVEPTGADLEPAEHELFVIQAVQVHEVHFVRGALGGVMFDVFGEFTSRVSLVSAVLERIAVTPAVGWGPAAALVSLTMCRGLGFVPVSAYGAARALWSDFFLHRWCPSQDRLLVWTDRSGTSGRYA